VIRLLDLGETGVDVRHTIDGSDCVHVEERRSREA
jgi:hypothetical protein